jgi:hypothetical protein
MAHLKNETVSKCFSLLRQFIDETPGRRNRRGAAVLALEQLQRVTAGTTQESNPVCIDIPRADGNPGDGEFDSVCIDIPRADGNPDPGGG